jgi:hypothetical protein
MYTGGSALDDRRCLHDGRMETVTIETCDCTWIFDADTMRFRRVLRDTEGDGRSFATAWLPYFRLEVNPDTETFTVVLTAGGTRMIRSSSHVGDCDQCRHDMSGELSCRTVP